MKLSTRSLGTMVFTTAAAVMTLLEPCLGAAWEGTDDFSGTLSKWDTTYLHPGQPSDGLFLTNGRLQLIKTVTTSDYEGSGAVIWPQSLPFNTNWTALVDVHLQPVSVQSSNPIDQDIRLAVFVIESVENYTGPTPKFINTVLNAGETSNRVRSGDLDSLPVVGGGWDFTLGVSFDASTRTGTAFYFPTNQPSQLVTLTNVHMVGWTNIQVALWGLSEYWAVGVGEAWMDNFRVYGTADSPTTVAIVKAVRPSFSNLILGRSYQLQLSADLNTWTNQGTPFTASNFNMVYPQYWDVDKWGKLFFRLQTVP